MDYERDLAKVDGDLQSELSAATLDVKERSQQLDYKENQNIAWVSQTDKKKKTSKKKRRIRKSAILPGAETSPVHHSPKLPPIEVAGFENKIFSTTGEVNLKTVKSDKDITNDASRHFIDNVITNMSPENGIEMEAAEEQVLEASNDSPLRTDVSVNEQCPDDNCINISKKNLVDSSCQQLVENCDQGAVSKMSERTSDRRPPSSPSKWRPLKHAIWINTYHRKRSDAEFIAKFNTNRRIMTSQENLENGLKTMSQKSSSEDLVSVKGGSFGKHIQLFLTAVKGPYHPDERFIVIWLLILSLAVEYNLWVMILRQAFILIQEESSSLWFACDAIADFIYVLDIAVQLRTAYIDDGLPVTKQSKLTRHYVYSKYFVLDIVSVIPLDLLYLAIGVNPILRFPRLLKLYRFAQFVYLAETHAAYPNVLRVCNLTHILLLLCHWFAAFFYMIANAEHFTGSWSEVFNTTAEYHETLRQYLTSLYWSTLTLTTIGNLPTPNSNWQYAFQIVSYHIGVFVFALIVGQVGNAVTNYNATRQEYENLLDGAKLYMRKHNVPKEMQTRVQRWYDYVWRRGRIQGALDINSLKMLPDRLKAELALHVHLDILKEVTIFNNCEPEFLNDLVLKMQTCIYTPGDIVIRKGEIAREMFIIADGYVEVIGEKGTIIAQLSKGNFFGEIGILNLNGGINRRTADVRSLGYSELFVLKREDIVRAIKYYPGAKASLLEHAKARLEEMRKHNDFGLIGNPGDGDEQFTDKESSRATPHVQEQTNMPEYERNVPEPKASNHLLPSCIPTEGGRTNSIYSVKSADLEQICENELVSQLKQAIEVKDKQIEFLTLQLRQFSREKVE